MSSGRRIRGAGVSASDVELGLAEAGLAHRAPAVGVKGSSRRRIPLGAGVIPRKAHRPSLSSSIGDAKATAPEVSFDDLTVPGHHASTAAEKDSHSSAIRKLAERNPALRRALNHKSTRRGFGAAPRPPAAASKWDRVKRRFFRTTPASPGMRVSVSLRGAKPFAPDIEMGLPRDFRRDISGATSSSSGSEESVYQYDLDALGETIEREYRKRRRSFRTDADIKNPYLEGLLENISNPLEVTEDPLYVRNNCDKKDIKAIEAADRERIEEGKIDILADGLKLGIDASKKEVVVYFDASNIHILEAYAAANRKKIELSESQEIKTGCGPCSRTRSINTGRTASLSLEEFIKEKYLDPERENLPYSDLLETLVKQGKSEWGGEGKFPEALVSSDLMKHMRFVVSGPLKAKKTQVSKSGCRDCFIPFDLSKMSVGNLTITDGVFRNLNLSESRIGRLKIQNAVLNEAKFDSSAIGAASILSTSSRQTLINCSFKDALIMGLGVFHNISQRGCDFGFQPGSRMYAAGGNVYLRKNVRLEKDEVILVDSAPPTSASGEPVSSKGLQAKDASGFKVSFEHSNPYEPVQSCANVDVSGLDEEVATIIDSARHSMRHRDVRFRERNGIRFFMPSEGTGDFFEGASGSAIGRRAFGEMPSPIVGVAESKSDSASGVGDFKSESPSVGAEDKKLPYSRRLSSHSDSAESPDSRRVRFRLSATSTIPGKDGESADLAAVAVVAEDGLGGLDSSGDAKATRGDLELPGPSSRRLRRADEHERYFGFRPDRRRGALYLGAPGRSAGGASPIRLRSTRSAGIIMRRKQTRLDGISISSVGTGQSLFAFLPEDIRVFSHIDDPDILVVSVRSSKLMELYMKLRRINHQKEENHVGEAGCPYTDEDLEASNQPFRLFVEYLLENKPGYSEYAKLLRPRPEAKEGEAVREYKERVMVNLTELGMLKPYRAKKLDLSGGDFSDCNFEGVIFNGKHVTLDETNFSGANLGKVKYANLSLSNLIISENTKKDKIPKGVKEKFDIDGVWVEQDSAIDPPDFGRASLKNIQRKLILFDSDSNEYSVISLVSPALERSEDVSRGQALVTASAGFVASSLSATILQLSLITSGLVGLATSFIFDRAITKARHREDLDGNDGWVTERLRDVGAAERDIIKSLYRFVDNHVPDSKRKPPEMMDKKSLRQYVSEQVSRGNYHPTLAVIQSRADEVRGEKIVALGLASTAFASAIISGNATLVKSLFIGAASYVGVRGASSGARYVSRQARGTFDTRNALGDYFRHIGITWGEVVSLEFAKSIITLFVANNLVKERTAKVALTATGAVSIADIVNRAVALGRLLRKSPMESEQRIKNQVSFLERNKWKSAAIYTAFSAAVISSPVTIPFAQSSFFSFEFMVLTVAVSIAISAAVTIFKIDSINRFFAPALAYIYDKKTSLSFCCSRETRSQFEERIVNQLYAQQKKILLDEVEALIEYISYRAEHNLDIPAYAMTRLSQYGKIFKDSGLPRDADYAKRVRRVVNRIVVSGSRTKYESQRHKTDKMLASFSASSKSKYPTPGLATAMRSFVSAAATSARDDVANRVGAAKDRVVGSASSAWGGMASGFMERVGWLGSFIPGLEGGAEVESPASVTTDGVLPASPVSAGSAASGVEPSPEAPRKLVLARGAGSPLSARSDGSSLTTTSPAEEEFVPTTHAAANEEANKRIIESHQKYLAFLEQYNEEMLVIKHAPIVEKLFQRRKQEISLMNQYLTPADIIQLEKEVKNRVIYHAKEGNLSEYYAREAKRIEDYIKNVHALLDVWHDAFTGELTQREIEEKKLEAAKIIASYKDPRRVEAFLDQERIRLRVRARRDSDIDLEAARTAAITSAVDTGAGVAFGGLGGVEDEESSYDSDEEGAGAGLGPSDLVHTLRGLGKASASALDTSAGVGFGGLGGQRVVSGMSRGDEVEVRSPMHVSVTIADSGLGGDDVKVAAPGIIGRRSRAMTPESARLASSIDLAGSDPLVAALAAAETRSPLRRVDAFSDILADVRRTSEVEMMADEVVREDGRVFSRGSDDEVVLLGRDQWMPNFHKKREIRVRKRLEKEKAEFIQGKIDNYEHVGFREGDDLSDSDRAVLIERYSKEFDEYQRQRAELFAIPVARAEADDSVPDSDAGDSVPGLDSMPTHGGTSFSRRASASSPDDDSVPDLESVPGSDAGDSVPGLDAMSTHGRTSFSRRASASSPDDDSVPDLESVPDSDAGDSVPGLDSMPTHGGTSLPRRASASSPGDDSVPGSDAGDSMPGLDAMSTHGGTSFSRRASASSPDDDLGEGASESKGEEAGSDGASSISSSGSGASEKLQEETRAVTAAYRTGQISRDAFNAVWDASAIHYNLRKRKQVLKGLEDGARSEKTEDLEYVPLPVLQAQKEFIDSIHSIDKDRRRWLGRLPMPAPAPPEPAPDLEIHVGATYARRIEVDRDESWLGTFGRVFGII